jgi:AcrR family transcriptional regulator
MFLYDIINNPYGRFFMTTAHHRLKQPEQVRAQLLLVVRDLLVEEGLHAVTLEAVALRAGVSKGGLQYHFRSKQALLDALCGQLLDEFEQLYAAVLSAEPEIPGRAARAYVRCSFDFAHPLNTVKTQRAIALLALNVPHFRASWRALMLGALADDGSDPQLAQRLLLCRLAADGFWFAQMLDVYALDETSNQTILLNILNLSAGVLP